MALRQTSERVIGRFTRLLQTAEFLRESAGLSAGLRGLLARLGYYFAVELHGVLNVPVGIINSSVGGTRVESWMPPAVLARPEFAPTKVAVKPEIAAQPETMEGSASAENKPRMLPRGRVQVCSTE